MGRQEKSLDPESGPTAAFAQALREVRQTAGITYRQMARYAHYSSSSLSLAAKGERLPSWPLTACFLKACGIRGEVELHDWHQRWSDAQRKVRAARRPLDAPVEIEGVQANREDSELAELLRMLEDLRTGRALTLRKVASKSLLVQHRREAAQWLSASRIHDVLHGKTRIDKVFIQMFLDACGANPDEREAIWSAAQKASVQDRLLRAKRKPKESPHDDQMTVRSEKPASFSVENLHKRQARYAINLVEAPPHGFLSDRQRVSKRVPSVSLYHVVLACMLVLIGYSILR